MNYPKEWPGFRVKNGGRFTRKGGIVEAVTAGTLHSGEALPEGHFGVRCLTGMRSDCIPDCHPEQGWYGHCVHALDVEPLTPGAREFLKSVPR